MSPGSTPWVVLALIALAPAGPARAQSAPAQGASAPKAAAFDDVVRQATAAREADRIDDAVRFYRQGVELRPAWEEGWWYLATLYYDKDRWSEGRDAFRRFLALKPDTGPGWVLLGLCEYQLQEHAPALEHLRKGVTLGLMTLRIARLPGATPPDQKDLVLAAGHAAYLHLDKRPDEAGTAYQDLVRRYPSAPYVHYAYGVFLLNQSSEGALEEFAKEIAIQPSSVYPYLEVAFERLRRGEPQLALPPAETAVKLAPRLFAARNALGRALVDTGSIERGLMELEAAAAVAPDSPEMFFSLARAYTKAGRKEDADRARATFAELDRKRRELRDGTPQP